MPQSCKDIRAALAFCLQNSDCIMVERNSPGDCLRPPLKYTLPTQCQQLQKGYAECKKGQIDMRKRFRGNRPIAVAGQLETGNFGSKKEKDEKEGTIEEKGYMLYAGRPYKNVRETDGNEREPEDK
ncbi:cytochrome c oxidase assembly protein PET191-domain-containing protein [Lophiotrema nucula]|uniref:Cytochrome c oxidase assembly protein PET191-domain-containing protein n=1 Tax=Lophiotrema nucula TaxID=690887 RepID=A0A6A5YK80_9PLEO|nr:cytochrome c oxidase assembly protein PET191-domain-containing protein [Lophiotrema nucula]